MDDLKMKTHIFKDEIGDAMITVYDVFPGVQLAYHSVHMEQLDLNFTGEGNLIEIHHCREGRIEQKFEDEYFYLMPGDLSIAKRTEMVQAYTFPLRHYHGITIGMDMDKVSDSFRYLLEEMRIQPLEIIRKLCGENNCYIIRTEQYVEHIFSELYAVPESIREGYFKVKILELLLVLDGKYQTEKPMQVFAVSKTQVQLANQAAAYLSENMEQRITIEELAKVFNVSSTHLKSIFKSVYGVPIVSYIRIQKMQSAAQLLIHTDDPIAEIAYKFGYNNTGKFSSAFQKIMGDTPGEYRREHRKYQL